MIGAIITIVDLIRTPALSDFTCKFSITMIAGDICYALTTPSTARSPCQAQDTVPNKQQMKQLPSTSGESEYYQPGRRVETAEYADNHCSIQIYLVIVIASLPFLKPLFVDNKAFSWTFYRSFILRVSQRSRSSSGQDRGQDGESGEGANGVKSLQSLPHVPKDRFVTTTLRNAGPGMETDKTFNSLSTVDTFDSVSSAEEGRPKKKK